MARRGFTTKANVNQPLFDRAEAVRTLEAFPTRRYDVWMRRHRTELVSTHGRGRDVLDLCCGNGNFLWPDGATPRSVVGVDFSRRMLRRCRDRVGARPGVRLAQADANRLPLRDHSVDFVYSFSSLYYVPEIHRTLQEVARVLRPGGFAAVELGNRFSLNTLVVRAERRARGWVEPHHISYPKMRAYLRNAGFVIVKRKSFQILPMYGGSRRLFYLYPLLSGKWKSIMGFRIGSRMLDEWVSGAWPFRFFAFRHLFLVRKPDVGNPPPTSARASKNRG